MPNTSDGTESTRAGSVNPAVPAGSVDGGPVGTPVVTDQVGASVEVPGYTIQDEIARGETCLVYKALDHDLKTHVALKVLAGNDPSPAIVEGFFETARISARLQHPGIPPVYKLGRLKDGRPFVAMRLISGRTLASLLAERSKTSPDRIRFLPLFERLCQLMASVHTQSVTHRNLTPRHVLVDDFAEVQVVGWGSAALHQTAPRLSPLAAAGPSPRPGTPEYMPPEQARGEWETVGPAADVFTLGAALTEILIGQPPFPAHSPEESLRRSAAGDLADAFYLLDCCGEDADLLSIAKRCLNPDPARRPAHAGELAALVSGYRNGLERRARQGEADRMAASAVAVEQARRKNYQLGLVLVVGLWLISFVGFFWLQERQAVNRELLNSTRAGPEKKTSETSDRTRSPVVKSERDIQKKATPPKRKLPLPPAEPKPVPAPATEGHIAPPPRELKPVDPG